MSECAVETSFALNEEGGEARARGEGKVGEEARGVIERMNKNRRRETGAGEAS